MLDLEPAARQMARMLEEVSADQLDVPTPCEKYSLGDLIDHIGGLSLAFTFAATKAPLPGGSQPPSGDASRLEAGWFERISAQLGELGQAWRDPAAWEGMTKAGGLDLPGAVTGNVALGELIIHGWDVARSIGRSYDLDPQLLTAYLGFAARVFDPSQRPAGGPFGLAVEVPADASVLDQIIGLSGRDPGWTSATS